MGQRIPEKEIANFKFGELRKSEFESKVILFGKLYCEFRKRIFFDRKWF